MSRLTTIRRLCEKFRTLSLPKCHFSSFAPAVLFYTRYSVLSTLLFTLLTSSIQAQLLTPLSGEMNRRAEYEMVKSGSPSFTVIKPYLDTLPSVQKPYQGVSRSWLSRKLFHESLIQVDSGVYYLFFDPAFDVAMGQDNSGRKTFTNTRGFNAGGRLGKYFAFGTSFYENQAIFPTWVHNHISNKIITGQGRGRLNGSTWDYAHSSGYISFTPFRHYNIQLGQGKNFIGDGYRSLLLSDVAYNYPYGRITYMGKRIMYSWMLAMIQDVSISNNNDLFAFGKRMISSHLVSANITPWFQLSVIKNTVYNNPDTTGKFSPGLAEFNPVMLPVNARNSHSIWGLNIKATLTRTLWLYSQAAFDNLTGEREMKVAIQAGVKYFDAFGLKGLYLQGEFNQAENAAYSWDNKTLYWFHYNDPLAHPYGNNFSEGLFNGVYSWRRWQINSLTMLTQQNDASILKKPPQFGFPAMANNTRVLHHKTEVNWFLNPKTTAHFSLGYVIHQESISEVKTNSSMVYFAFRTSLFNNYLLY